MVSTTELTIDLEGRLVQVTRNEFSLIENAAAAGRVRAWAGKDIVKNRKELASHLRVREFWVSTQVWNAYETAYKENV